MKVKVLKSFKDKYTKTEYVAGDEITLSEARFSEMVKNLETYGGGFVEKMPQVEEVHNEVHQEEEDDTELLAHEFKVKAREVARLKLGQLREKCEEFGIKYAQEDTKAILFGKITCHLKGC